MIQVVDRVPTYPNRIKITREDGSTELVTWERADEPTVEGTPINKALFDSIAADLGNGLSASKTVYVSNAGSDALGDGTAANPYATITKAINSLPKNLNGFDTTINIAAGTYDENVSIFKTFGGVIILSGAAGASVQIRSLEVYHGSTVQISNINLSVAGMFNGNAIYVSNASLISSAPVSVTGSVTNGVYLSQGAYARFESLSIGGTTHAGIYALNTSQLYVLNVSGENNSGFGLRVVDGASVAYNVVTLNAVTRYSTASGGRIYSGAQTSIPNY